MTILAIVILAAGYVVAAPLICAVIAGKSK